MIKLSAFADEADNSLQGQIDALKRNHLQYLEIRNVDGKNVADLTDEEAQRIYERLRAERLGVWAVGSPLGKVDIDCGFDAYKDKVRRVCEIANLLHTDKIRVFSFFKAYGQAGKVKEHLAEMVKIASEYGVYLYHENEKEIYGDVLSRVLELLDNVAGLRCVYDPANFIQVGEKAEDTLSALAHRAGYFHIKDVIAETDELVPAGLGDGDIAGLIACVDRDTVLTLEPHLAVFDGYASIDNTEMKNKFVFKDNNEAFDTAVTALKALLTKAGYIETADGFVK